jgi:hypothetical protein
MSAAAELSYGEAVDAYYRLLEDAGQTMIEQPGQAASYRVKNGWRFRNIRGDLAYVLDSGEFGDLRDLEPEPDDE